MATRMAAADLAIGAGGATTWERCSLGLPSIIVEIADNQAGVAQTLSAAGAALDPGSVLAPDFVRKLLAVLAAATIPARLGMMTEKAASICDGGGCNKVAAHLLRLAAS